MRTHNYVNAPSSLKSATCIQHSIKITFSEISVNLPSGVNGFADELGDGEEEGENPPVFPRAFLLSLAAVGGDMILDSLSLEAAAAAASLPTLANIFFRFLSLRLGESLIIRGDFGLESFGGGVTLMYNTVRRVHKTMH